MEKNKKAAHRIAGIVSLSLIVAALHWQCVTGQLTGGGSDTEVSGRMLAAGGLPASGAVVALISTGYDPAFDGELPVRLIDTTDPRGNYHFDSVATGTYNVWAEDRDLGMLALISDISVEAEKETRVNDGTMKAWATLRMALPDSLAGRTGRVSVPGTRLWAAALGQSAVVEISAVPQGIVSSIRFRESQPDVPIVLYNNITIDSAGLFVLDPYTAWQHEARVSFNTTGSGANLDETLLNFSALIRLAATDLDFSKARSEGEDLRLARDDHTPVPFEIEYWDSTTSSAVIWVLVDTVQANSTAQGLRLLWGNPAAKKMSRPAIVFDTARGFQGVWHLGESGPDDKKDATANGFIGSPVELTGSSDVAGVAGRGLDLDGSSQCVTVLNARNSRLDVQSDSFYTVSAWVYLRNVQRDNRVIVSKGSAQFGLMANERNQWEFYGGLRGYGVDTTTTSAATINVWTHLTGVRQGKRQYLYVNGVIADSTASAAGVSASISDNYYDFVIGRQSDDESQWFDGLIDEVRVENRSRSAAWTRLCYENQRTGQRFFQIQRIR